MLASTSARPHMPMPPMPTKWILVSGLRNIRAPPYQGLACDASVLTLRRNMSQINAPTVGAVPVRTVSADHDLKVARTIVNALDRYYLDPIIGFLAPGLGDVITTLIGMYLVVVAHRRGVKPIVIARMLL